jgi:ribosomal 30S subunit maturation factor RimM
MREGGETLVPFVPAVVDEVDFETSRIVVDWELDY